jgi:O-Antigen ligase
MNLADRNRMRQGMSQLGIISMVCLTVTAPYIVISQSLPYFRAEQLLLPIFVGAYVWLLLTGVTRTIRPNGMVLVGLLFFICTAISTFYGAVILGHPLYLPDLYELPKVWFPVAFFTIAYEANLSESGLRRLIAAFSVAILLVCFYAWCQFVGLGFTYKLNSYYSSGGHIDAGLSYARRVYATMGNPNALGILMTWALVLFLLAALLHVGGRLRNGFIALACLATLTMTGSRYALITAVIGIGLVLVFVSSTGRRGRSRIFLFVLLVPLFVWMFQTVALSNRRTLNRFEALRNPLKVDSLRQRLDVLWPETWAEISRSPLVGNGPGKLFFTRRDKYVPAESFVDSEYLVVLRSEGILGFLAFLSYYVYPLYLMRKAQRVVPNLSNLLLERASATLVTLHAGFIFGALALIMNVGMGTFYNPILQGFLWLWLGIGAGSARTILDLVPHYHPSFTIQHLSKTREVSFV